MSRHLMIIALAAGAVWSQTAPRPAARQHVKMVGGNAIKFTSKLTAIVDLNFTMGNGHQSGKQAITTTLTRIAAAYGSGGVDAFTIKHFTSALDGSKAGEVPNFTVEDLLKADVIVADNISHFGDPIMGVARQQAFQRAIEVEGKGYLGFHGSGDNKLSTWPWFTNTLHPVNYDGHGTRAPGPVYREPKSEKHIVLEGMFTSKTVAATVPNGVDASGKAILTPGILTRSMTNEWYRNGRDLAADAGFKDKVTPLLKYDARPLGTDALPAQYKREGGNLYTYLYKVGAGMTSYLPAGHEPEELNVGAVSFDGGGSGDLDRYIAQMLFFLAGYKQQVCDASCGGLPLVDERNLIIGTVGINGRDPMRLPATGKPFVWMDLAHPEFRIVGKARYDVVFSDVSGRTLNRFRGKGEAAHTWDPATLKPGIYFLTARAGNAEAMTQRYLISPRGL